MTKQDCLNFLTKNKLFQFLVINFKYHFIIVIFITNEAKFMNSGFNFKFTKYFTSLKLKLKIFIFK